VIPPRRVETSDVELVRGVLGLVTVAAEVRTLVAELASESSGDVEVDPDSDLVAAMLGLAALARAIDARVPREPAPAPVVEPREPIDIGDLLR
jgi:hypothetical protein